MTLKRARSIEKRVVDLFRMSANFSRSTSPKGNSSAVQVAWL